MVSVSLWGIGTKILRAHKQGHLGDTDDITDPFFFLSPCNLKQINILERENHREA